MITCVLLVYVIFWHPVVIATSILTDKISVVVSIYFLHIVYNSDLLIHSFTHRRKRGCHPLLSTKKTFRCV